MIVSANLGFARTSLHRCAVALALALAACTTSPELGRLGFGAASTTMQFTMGRVDRSWMVAPNAVVLMQRSSRSATEQMIGLENATTLPGDNFLWLNAVAGRGAFPGGKLRLEQVIERAGGVPSPFTALNNQNLRSGSDSLGPYFWQEYRSGAQTNCVLAVRQLKGGARSLPSGTRELEVLLRNCVNGSIEEALLPIRDTRVSRATMIYSNPTEGIGATRSLSPLAAPRQ